MSGISVLVKELREIADCYYGEISSHAGKISQAADTIETLSENLAAANMERSDRYYDVRKELVEWHNNAFELINKMPLEGNEVWHGYVGGVMQTLGHLIDSMGKPDRHNAGGWISCEDRLPEEHKLCDITFENSVGIHSDSAIYNPYLKRWLWDADETELVENKVLAWAEKRKPYRP